MPTKRQRKRRTRIADVSPDLWAFLTDNEPEYPDEIFFLTPNEIRAAWELCRDRILADWIQTKGGTRPSHWWKYDAPRLTEVPDRFARCSFAAEMIEPRLLLSGAGRPAWEVLAIAPNCHYGVPASWVGWNDGDPPVFETQFEYLRRHALLAPDETQLREGLLPK